MTFEPSRAGTARRRWISPVVVITLALPVLTAWDARVSAPGPSWLVLVGVVGIIGSLIPAAGVARAPLFRRLHRGTSPEHREPGRVRGAEATCRAMLDAARDAVMDITQRKRADSALRAHKDELHHAQQVLSSHLENSPLAAVEWDREFRVIRWFGQAEKLFGWTEAEVLNRRPDDEWRFVHEDDQRAVHETMWDLWSGAVPRNLSTNRNYTRSGDVIHCDWYNSGLLDDQGRVVSILSLAHDVTQRHRAERALRDLSARLLRLQDEERRRLARELHDTTAQNLSALTMSLEVLERATAPDDARLRLLNDCRELARGSVREIRTLSYLLHPPLLDDFGFVRAMRHYVSGFSERSGIDVDLDAPEDLERFSEDVEMALFRVLQESLGNVHRHSGSRVARVRLTRDQRHVCLEIRDEGCGLPSGLTSGRAIEVASGVGLIGMRERMRQLGGRMELETGLPGALVRAILPIMRPV